MISSTLLEVCLTLLVSLTSCLALLSSFLRSEFDVNKFFLCSFALLPLPLGITDSIVADLLNSLINLLSFSFDSEVASGDENYIQCVRFVTVLPASPISPSPLPEFPFSLWLTLLDFTLDLHPQGNKQKQSYKFYVFACVCSSLSVISPYMYLLLLLFSSSKVRTLLWSKMVLKWNIIWIIKNFRERDLVVKKALGSLESLTAQDHFLSLIELWDLGTTPQFACMVKTLAEEKQWRRYFSSKHTRVTSIYCKSYIVW